MDSPEPARTVDHRSAQEKQGADSAADALIRRLARAKGLRGKDDFGFETSAKMETAINAMYDEERRTTPEDITNKSSESGFSAFRNAGTTGKINKAIQEIGSRVAAQESGAYPGFWEAVQTDFKMPYLPPAGKFGHKGGEQNSPFWKLGGKAVRMGINAATGSGGGGGGDWMMPPVESPMGWT